MEPVNGLAGVGAPAQTGATQEAAATSSADLNKAIEEGAAGILFGVIMGMQREVKRNLDEAANAAK